MSGDKGVKRKLLQFVAVIYFLGVTIAFPYDSYCFSRQQGFLAWLFLGNTLATIESFFWPIETAWSAAQIKTCAGPDNCHYVFPELAKLVGAKPDTQKINNPPETHESPLWLCPKKDPLGIFEKTPCQPWPVPNATPNDPLGLGPLKPRRSHDKKN